MIATDPLQAIVDATEPIDFADIKPDGRVYVALCRGDACVFEVERVDVDARAITTAARAWIPDSDNVSWRVYPDSAPTPEPVKPKPGEIGFVTFRGPLDPPVTERAVADEYGNLTLLNAERDRQHRRHHLLDARQGRPR